MPGGALLTWADESDGTVQGRFLSAAGMGIDQACGDRAWDRAVMLLADEARRLLPPSARNPHAFQEGRDELAVRPDVYGYDTLAWALLASGDAVGAQAPMQSALAAGTKDARLWYHAGLIALANGQTAEASTFLADALALGPALDPIAHQRAAAALATIR